MIHDGRAGCPSSYRNIVGVHAERGLDQAAMPKLSEHFLLTLLRGWADIPPAQDCVLDLKHAAKPLWKT